MLWMHNQVFHMFDSVLHWLDESKYKMYQGKLCLCSNLLIYKSLNINWWHIVRKQYGPNLDKIQKHCKTL